MLNFLKKHWLGCIQEMDTSAIVPDQVQFIAREYNAWKAWDAIGLLLKKKKKESGNEWKVISMTRV